MKLKELLESIQDFKKEYPDIEDWDVYIEIIQESAPTLKKRGWKVFKDSEGWEFVNIEGGIGLEPKEKKVLILLNY